MKLLEECAKIPATKTGLLLHSCCAPCLTVANQRLSLSYELSVFWFNPNIEPFFEHEKRLKVLKKYLQQFDLTLISEYDWETENNNWHNFIKGLENEPEGGKRCQKCFQYRLNRTGEYAGKNGFGSFSTTLTVSPHKNTKNINLEGEKSAKKHGVDFSAFNLKEKDGFRQSVELSKKFGLYRQNYCGCRYSMRTE